MIDKPQEPLMLVGLFSLVILTIAVGVNDWSNWGAAIDPEDDKLFANVTITTGTSGLSGAAGNLTDAVKAGDAGGDDGFIDTTSKGLVGLGSGVGLMKDYAIVAGARLMIPTYFYAIIGGMLAISFIVILYVYWRGGVN